MKTGPNQEDTTNISSLAKLAKTEGIPAISIASFSQQEEIQSCTIGVLENGTSKKATDESIFEAASLSKPVFSYIVLKMSGRGEIDLDTPLIELLEQKFGQGHPNAQFGPPFPEIRKHENYTKLTARMLLSHQAGLPNEFEPPQFHFISNAGEKFDYSGEAYRFLNEVIEKIIEPKSLEDLAQEEFKKIGMMHSSFVRPEDTDDLAIGHHENGEADLRQHFYGVHPAGSLHTTAKDYGKFLKACVEDGFVKREMFKPIVKTLTSKDIKGINQHVPNEVLDQIGWGLGIGLQNNSDGSLTAFHWGDGSGTCRNFAAINLSTKQGIACLTNSASGPAAFRQVSEPVVGDLTAVSQWLYQRESLPMRTVPTPKRTLSPALDFHKNRSAKEKKSSESDYLTTGATLQVPEEKAKKSTIAQSKIKPKHK